MECTPRRNHSALRISSCRHNSSNLLAHTLQISSCTTHRQEEQLHQDFPRVWCLLWHSLATGQINEIPFNSIIRVECTPRRNHSALRISSCRHNSSNLLAHTLQISSCTTHRQEEQLHQDFPRVWCLLWHSLATGQINEIPFNSIIRVECTPRRNHSALRISSCRHN